MDKAPSCNSTPDALVATCASLCANSSARTIRGFGCCRSATARGLAAPPSDRWEIANGTIRDRRRDTLVEPVAAEESGREAASKLLWQGTDLLPVTDADGGLVGEVGFEALRRAGRRSMTLPEPAGRHWALAASLALFLLLFCSGRPAPPLEPLVQAGAPPIYDRGTFLELTVSHVLTVLAAGLVAFAVAVALAIW